MNYLATLTHLCHIPPGSIYRGNGKFDFYSTALPDICKEKLKETKDNGDAVYTKPGENTKVAAELKKQSKPVSKPQKLLTTAQVAAEKAAKEAKEKAVKP